MTNVQPKCVLVVEDDSAIRQGLVDALKFSGYEVLGAATGQEGSRLVSTANIDLMILDLVLPGTGGFEILRMTRELRPTLPVLIVTARGGEDDRVKGLRMGADDYVVKPFSVRELLARVEAVLRRSPERPAEIRSVSFPGGVVDFERREIRFEDGVRAELSDRELELLKYLVRSCGRAISREEILRRVWRLDPKRLETRTIDMHVANLRTKLRDDPARPGLILTVRGRGYSWGGILDKAGTAEEKR